MVSYEDNLPLKWAPASGSEPAADCGRNRANLLVLESVAAIEEKPSEHAFEDCPEIQQELRRLDVKLHVLMEMVARLLREEESLGPSRPVRIALKTLEFRAADGEAAAGQSGTVSLQLHSGVPTPLVMNGQVVEELERDGERWVRFEPDRLSEPLRDALSRHVFRHHRRQVAASRRE